MNQRENNIGNPDTRGEICGKIYSILKEAGFDFSTVPQEIKERIDLLKNKTNFIAETEKTLELAKLFFDFVEKKNEKGEIDWLFNEDNRRIILAGTCFSDIGKTGPEDASRDQQEIFLDIYAKSNICVNGKTNPGEISFKEFMEFYFPEDFQERIETIGDITVKTSEDKEGFSFQISIKEKNFL